MRSTATYYSVMIFYLEQGFLTGIVSPYAIGAASGDNLICLHWKVWVRCSYKLLDHDRCNNQKPVCS